MTVFVLATLAVLVLLAFFRAPVFVWTTAIGVIGATWATVLGLGVGMNAALGAVFLGEGFCFNRAVGAQEGE